MTLADWFREHRRLKNIIWDLNETLDMVYELAASCATQKGGTIDARLVCDLVDKKNRAS